MIAALRPAGLGFAVEIADMDAETYSEAGFVWDDATNKWTCLPNASQGKKGLGVVGAARYTEHPSAEVLSWAYDLKDGCGRRYWLPGLPNPVDLFDHLAAGRLVEAWNAAFERWVWANICVPRYGWPPLPFRQVRCAMAKARAAAWPGSLEEAGNAMRLTTRKDPEGKRLLDKFSKPRNPTKADPRRRIRMADDIVDAGKLIAYNGTDIETEAEASRQCPDLTGIDLEYWLADQMINTRGVGLDVESVENCTALVAQAHAKYNAELHALTGIDAASKVQQIQGWLHARGVHMDSLDEETVAAMLKADYLEPVVRRVLEIRQAIGSSAVKKLYAMANQVTADGRLHDLFSFNAARTGRPTGNGPQPTNLPNSGPDVWLCDCGRYFGQHLAACPWCKTPTVTS